MAKPIVKFDTSKLETWKTLNDGHFAYIVKVF